MSRASRYKLDSKDLSEIADHFTYLVSSLTDRKVVENFLDEFLTKEEKVMLAKRLVLFMMLKRNYPPSAIISALHISYETIRTYHNQLQTKSSMFHAILEKLIKREKTKEFFKKLDKLIKPVKLLATAKGDIRSRAKLMSGDWS